MGNEQTKVDVLAAERDARTIYDIACIREDQIGASREDVEFKAIALRNYQFCAAVAEVFEAIKVYREDYRQSGCPDPACIVCRRSKAAEDRLDTALRNAGVKV